LPGSSVKVTASAGATPSWATATGACDGELVVGGREGASVGSAEGIGVCSGDGARDGIREGKELGCVDGNSEGSFEGSGDGSCEGFRSGRKDGSIVKRMLGEGAMDGWMLAPDCTSGGQLAPPSDVITTIVLARDRPLVASQAAQTRQLSQELTTQSTGQVPMLQAEPSCVSGHAAPPSRMARVRYWTPASQVSEQLVHCCRTKLQQSSKTCSLFSEKKTQAQDPVRAPATSPSGSPLH
jgi:hypothetical protein